MSVNISPARMFRDNKEIATQFRQIALSPVLHSAIAHAIGQYAMENPTQEQLSGARKFIDILTNIAEPEMEPRGAFPEKRLNYEQPAPGPNQVKPSDRKNK